MSALAPNATLERIMAAIRKAREADLVYWAKAGTLTREPMPR